MVYVNLRTKGTILIPTAGATYDLENDEFILLNISPGPGIHFNNFYLRRKPAGQ